jgi:hypothetical protein
MGSRGRQRQLGRAPGPLSSLLAPDVDPDHAPDIAMLGIGLMELVIIAAVLVVSLAMIAVPVVVVVLVGRRRRSKPPSRRPHV